jgi:hypothetical protein
MTTNFRGVSLLGVGRKVCSTVWDARKSGVRENDVRKGAVLEDALGVAWESDERRPDRDKWTSDEGEVSASRDRLYEAGSSAECLTDKFEEPDETRGPKGPCDALRSERNVDVSPRNPVS